MFDPVMDPHSPGVWLNRREGTSPRPRGTAPDRPLRPAAMGRISRRSCLVVTVSPRNRTVEQELARIASRAQGIVTRPELLRARVSDAEIRWRVRTGALHTEYPGVYRVGHLAPNLEARYLAAVKACGDGALLSGRAAAFLLRLTPGPAPSPEVTTPTERRIDGIATRRSATICRRDGMRFRGIPVTNVPRNL